MKRETEKDSKTSQLQKQKRKERPLSRRSFLHPVIENLIAFILFRTEWGRAFGKLLNEEVSTSITLLLKALIYILVGAISVLITFLFLFMALYSTVLLLFDNPIYAFLICAAIALSVSVIFIKVGIKFAKRSVDFKKRRNR